MPLISRTFVIRYRNPLCTEFPTKLEEILGSSDFVKVGVAIQSQFSAQDSKYH